MFYYFGYGSNISLTSLKAKGVDPISYEPAFLEGWELCFDLPNFFHIEGGTGNIRPREDKTVHGVLYECLDEHLPILDELEAKGVCYVRKKMEVRTYHKRSAVAYIYIGIEDRRQEGQQPSQRYKNILVHGAKEMNLNKDYIESLESIEVKPEPMFRPFRFPSQPSRIFSLSDLKQLSQHTALAGAVFNMANAREEHSYLKEFFDGRDMSLFFLKRMDSSDGQESFDKITEGKLSLAQKRYLTNYLHEFDKEYCYVGRMDYQINLAGNIRSNNIHRAPFERQFIPSRVVLDHAEKVNNSLQHENLGFLSIEHGFMPKFPPKMDLPAEFMIWDQMVRQLPNLYRSLELRKMLDDMPVLDASDKFLGDTYLLRAASVLAMLSHAYAYTETNKLDRLPVSLSKPWEQVRNRLGREQEVLSYIDLIVYNWKFKDKKRENLSHFTKRKVENMDLLIPTVGNRAESQFYLTQTEILAQTTPIIHSIVNCQEAAKNRDVQRLKEHLLEIIDVLDSIVQHSLPKINPCEESEHFVDPVLWAKTVAPFAVPLKDGLQGPSGTSSPIFNLMDVFLGRKEYSTFLGKEIKSLRGTYPLFWQEFIKAVAEISISSFIDKSEDKALKSLLKDTVNLYAGENGFLGKHRLKVFGYLETAFKVGRSVTIGGFSGAFRDRTWEQVDSELEYSRIERMLSFPKGCHYAFVKSIGQTHSSGAEGVKHVVLDISHTGIRYQPGDRCVILPENSDELVEKTLKALKAEGNTQIPLSDEWIKATSLRYGYQDSRSLSLRDFLKFARIRPVEPRLAEALHASSQSSMLLAAIRQQTVEQWELWDLLILLGKNGYDVTRLWKANFNSSEHISRVVPPENFRRYSIATCDDEERRNQEIHLTVGKVTYLAKDQETGEQTMRYGSASHFLASAAGRKQPISFIIERPSRFSLPSDPKIPIIMLAGGTGFAPFRGFAMERLKNRESGLSWVILGLKSREYFYYNDNFIPGLANQTLRLDVVFSQEDSRVAFRKTSENNGELYYPPGKRGYIKSFLTNPEVAREIWQKLKDIGEGGEGAYLYVCGRTRFAKTCLESLHQIFAQFAEGTAEEKHKQAHKSLYRISASGRFMMEVFSHSQSTESRNNQHHISEVCLHNDHENGYWLIIDHKIYDISQFVELHPGGRVPLTNYAGTDATQGYLRAHNGRSEIDAMKGIYEIGVTIQIDFKGVQFTTKKDKSVVLLASFYRNWLNTCYLVVEMQNALILDQSLQEKATTKNENPADMTFLKIQREIETHERFLVSYVNELVLNTFQKLWKLTVSICQSEESNKILADAYLNIEEVLNTNHAKSVCDGFRSYLDEIRTSESTMFEVKKLTGSIQNIEANDRNFLQDIKSTLVDGLRCFEKYEDKTIENAHENLIKIIHSDIPSIVRRFFFVEREICDQFINKIETRSDLTVRNKAEVEHQLILKNKYWELEKLSEQDVLVLRRTAVNISSLPHFLDSNEELIKTFPQFNGYGIVVDMRQAQGRNDPEFENSMMELRININAVFSRVAVLLVSKTGVLQVNRIGRNEGVDNFATVSESAAIRFAKGAA